MIGLRLISRPRYDKRLLSLTTGARKRKPYRVLTCLQFPVENKYEMVRSGARLFRDVPAQYGLGLSVLDSRFWVVGDVGEACLLRGLCIPVACATPIFAALPVS
jgi:hypothetical protein